jgi:hypothetical protein
MPGRDEHRGTAKHRASVDIGVALRDALETLGGAFAENELAYLTVTSKVEGPVRDRLAWLLQTALGPGYVVAREYHRADLAVLTPDGTLLTQLEAKVLCTFNALKDADRERYLGYLAKDAEKMMKLPLSERFLLSIMFDVRGDIPSEPKRVVKYATDIRRSAKQNPDGGVREKAQKEWRKGLTTKFGSETELIEIDAGTIWGLDVSVDCFLTGPLIRPETGVQNRVKT